MFWLPLGWPGGDTIFIKVGHDRSVGNLKTLYQLKVF